MNVLNKEGPIDHFYIAGFKQEKVGIYARSLSAAKQKAVEHFKPKKKDTGLLWVELLSQKEITPTF